MTGRPKIECDIHDLLGEANIVLLIGISDMEKARHLIDRLRHCAAQAQSAEHKESGRHVLEVAERLEKRLTPCVVPPIAVVPLTSVSSPNCG